MLLLCQAPHVAILTAFALAMAYAQDAKREGYLWIVNYYSWTCSESMSSYSNGPEGSML